MSSERHEELAALHALGLLEGAEKSAFESALVTEPELRRLLPDLRDAAAALALTVPQLDPPAGLKEALLARIPDANPDSSDASPSAAGSSSGHGGDHQPRGPFTPLLPWALAAGFALAALWFAGSTFSLRSANRTLQTERELADVAFRMAQAQLNERTLLAERMIADLGARLQRSEDLSRLKITALASLLGNTPEAKAIAVWDPEQQRGLLTVEKLPAIASEQDYQIWVIDPQYPIPVDGGVFKPDPTGRATLTFKGDKPVSEAKAFAISLEKAGGVPKAEGPMVLLGQRL